MGNARLASCPISMSGGKEGGREAGRKAERGAAKAKFSSVEIETDVLIFYDAAGSIQGEVIYWAKSSVRVLF